MEHKLSSLTKEILESGDLPHQNLGYQTILHHLGGRYRAPRLAAYTVLATLQKQGLVYRRKGFRAVFDRLPGVQGLPKVVETRDVRVGVFEVVRVLRLLRPHGLTGCQEWILFSTPFGESYQKIMEAAAPYICRNGGNLWWNGTYPEGFIAYVRDHAVELNLPAPLTVEAIVAEILRFPEGLTVQDVSTLLRRGVTDNPYFMLYHRIRRAVDLGLLIQSSVRPTSKFKRRIVYVASDLARSLDFLGATG